MSRPSFTPRARPAFRLTPLAAAVSLALCASALLGPQPGAAQVLPVAPTVVHGAASISSANNRMLVTNTPNAIIDWQAFSIGARNAVRFEQQNSASQVLNRVVGKDLSSILGSLSSNGKVWLVNPNGVVFGQGARIDVGGLVASTLAISNEDFLSGKYAFQSTASRAGVVNKGEITTPVGGRVWLVGETVGNEGAIRADGGSIVLAAGKSVELVDSAAPNVRVRLTAPDNEVLNLGSLLSRGGSIDLHAGMVNQQGIVRADSLGVDAAGRITMYARGDVRLGAASITTASGGGGGTVTLDAAEGLTEVSGKVAAAGSAGRGGQVLLQGEQVRLAAGSDVNASGARGGGRVLVGGDYQGQNPDVHKARQTVVARGAGISADATQQGDGGRIIVWGTDSLQMHGSISAQGGPNGGNGGFLETSGARLDVRTQDIALRGGPGGKAGAWLIDPNNIRITDDQIDNVLVQDGVITSDGDDTIVTANTIMSVIENGTNLTVRTGTAGANSQPGDITVEADIVPARRSSGPDLGSLTLEAHRDVRMVGHEIRSFGGAMPVTLLADHDQNGSGQVLLDRSSIVTLGGNITLQSTGANSVHLSTVTLNAGSGAVSIISRDVANPAGGVFPGFVFDASGITGDSVQITGGTMRANVSGPGSSSIDAIGAVGIGMDSELDLQRTHIQAASGVSLRSGGNVVLESGSIRGSSVGMPVIITADSDSNQHGSARVSNSDIATGGSGSIAISGGGQLSDDHGVLLASSTLNAGVGSVALTGADRPDSFLGVVITDGSITADVLRLRGGTAALGDVDIRLGQGGLDAVLASLVHAASGARSVEVVDGSTRYSANSMVFSSGPVHVNATGFAAGPGAALVSRSDIALTAAGTSLVWFEVAQVGTGASIQSEGNFRLDGGALGMDRASIVAQGRIDLNLASDLSLRNGAAIRSGGTMTLAGGPNPQGPNLTLADSTLSMPEGRLRVNQFSASGASSSLVPSVGPLEIAANTFQNSVGSQLISDVNTVAGWRLYLPQPQDVGGLPYDFEQFNAPAFTPAAGDRRANGVLYGVPLQFRVHLPGRAYDGGTNLTFTNFQFTDPPCCGDYRVVASGDTLDAASFGDKNAGLAKPVTYTGNKFSVQGARSNPVFGAQLGYTSDIFQKQLTATAAQAQDKVYDGNANAQGSVTLGGVVPGDQVTAVAAGTFGSRAGERPKDVAADKPVTLTVGLSGADSANYVAPSGQLSATADITPRPVPVVRVSASDKVYDGTANVTTTLELDQAAFVPGDQVTPLATAAFGSRAGERPKDVATDKPVIFTIRFDGADGANYAVPQGALAATTASITPLQLGLAGLSAADKVYDGNANAQGAVTLSGFLPGDQVTSASAGTFGSRGSERPKDVAADKPVTFTVTLSGDDSINYVAPQGPLVSTASITPRQLGLVGVSAADKVYDTTTAASASAAGLSNAVAGDAVSLGAVTGVFGSKAGEPARSVANDKPVTVTVNLSGADARNYTPPVASTTADITPATLTFVADPAQRFAGSDLSGLGGTVSGLRGSDTLASETSGSLTWTTAATPASTPGTYPIFGGGLASSNYVFVQDPANARALTLAPAQTQGPGRILDEALVSTVDSALRTALAISSAPTGGSVLDVSGGTGRALFGAINVGGRSEDELSRLLEDRRQFKRKLFADAIHKLELDPALADVPICRTIGDGASGNCRFSDEQLAEIQQRRQAQPAPSAAPDSPARRGALPQIQRKVALFLGVSQYADKKIPTVDTALPDVESVSKLVAARMGYETRIVRNPTKQEIVAALNQLATELGPQDSLLIYYSGHGYTLERNGAGYWLASDAPVDDPRRWISNEDVTRLLAAIPARQVALVTDSCYSAAFTREGTAAVGGGASADELLTKRSVVVLASGGDEPVSDEGKDGHSVFAWNLMETLRSVESWRPGTNVFSQIQAGVRKELPQTPRYGAMSAAGHQRGGDYLFEQR